MTEKLYYSDPFQKTFTAAVLACEAEKDRFAVVLDRTSFYPEGGGQPADTGALGEAEVLDVRERDGVIRHLCSRPLSVGAEVTGAIDWERRFDHMQQHSGEHIVSGFLCRRYGCDNVGFHMGHDLVTIDFNFPHPAGGPAGHRGGGQRLSLGGPGRGDRLSQRGGPGTGSLPQQEVHPRGGAAGDLSRGGLLRLLRHPRPLRRTGGAHQAPDLPEVPGRGAHRDGRRGPGPPVLRGGAGAEHEDLPPPQRQGPGTPPPRWSGAQRELYAIRGRLTALEEESFAQKAQALAGAGDVLLLEGEMSSESVRKLCAVVLETCGGRCAVFAGADGSWKYGRGPARRGPQAADKGPERRPERPGRRQERLRPGERRRQRGGDPRLSSPGGEVFHPLRKTRPRFPSERERTGPFGPVLLFSIDALFAPTSSP